MPDVAAPVTLSSWVAEATGRLGAAGSPTPRSEAERLAAHALGLSWGDLWSRMRDPIDEDRLEALAAVLERRARGEPLAYIEGSVVFRGLEIECGPGVLVPRPETESLVDVALEMIDGLADPVVADIGCGTGAVSIAIASERPDADVWATDSCTVALEWAARNVSARKVAVRLAHGDLLGALPPRMRGGVDLVVSNPPYVPIGADLPADVRAEPSEALFAGPLGDDMLLRLVREAPAWLSSRGALALEVGTGEQAERVADARHAFREVGIRNDDTQRARVLWMKR